MNPATLHADGAPDPRTGYQFFQLQIAIDSEP